MSKPDLPSLHFRLDLTRLGAMLRTMRKAAGLTQAEVAEKLGTTQSAIARLEQDTHGGVSLRRIADYAAACGYVPLWSEPYTPPKTYVSPAAMTAQPAKPTTAGNYPTLLPMAS